MTGGGEANVRDELSPLALLRPSCCIALFDACFCDPYPILIPFFSFAFPGAGSEGKRG